MMRLRGSRTEEIIRRKFVAIDTKGNGEVVNFLKERYGNIQSAYCLSWAPLSWSLGEEEVEYVYTILVNGSVIISFELSEIDGKIKVRFEKSVFEYSKRLRGRQRHLKLAIAMDLAKAAAKNG